MKTGIRNEAIGNSKKTKVVGFALCAILFALCAAAEAQQTKKMARIGYLSGRSGPFEVLAAFKEGLRELGWVEGKDINYEYRYGGNDLDKLSEFATELVHLNVDVIVAGPDNGPTIAAKHATTTIPIVMVGVADPVTTGLVASLARPGGNVTGVTWEVTREQAGKNLELLKEAAPKVSHVAILRNPNVPYQMSYSKEAERAAKSLGVTVRFAEVQSFNRKELEDALGTIARERDNGVLVTPGAFFSIGPARTVIVDFLTRSKLPAIYPGDVFVDREGLMFYGPSYHDIHRRAVTYVDKILKGAQPADLPVEQPKKFELVINLKAAKKIGVTITPNVLARADRVIR